MKSGLKDMGPVMSVIGPCPATAGFSLRAWAKANPDTVVKYLQAYVEGLRWGLDPKNKDAATTLLAERLKLTPELAAECYALITDPATGLAKDGKFDMDENSRTSSGCAPSSKAVKRSHPGEYLDLSYYEKALAGL